MSPRPHLASLLDAMDLDPVRILADWKLHGGAYGGAEPPPPSSSPESSMDSMCSSPETCYPGGGGGGPLEMAGLAFGFAEEQRRGGRAAAAGGAARPGKSGKMSTKRRMKASEREKLRMRSLAEALHQLRDYLPPDYSRRGQPLTKIQTLKYTIDYIKRLSELLGRA